MSDYALTGKLGRGGAPQKSDDKWHKVYEKISACPVTEQLKALGYIQQTFFSSKPKCNCGYNHEKKKNTTTPTPANNNAPSTKPPPPPPVIIPYNILQKPSARTKLNEVKDISYTYTKKGFYPLTVFGHTGGKCPHCKSSNIQHTNINSKVKIIHTLNEPRFLQGFHHAKSANSNRNVGLRRQQDQATGRVRPDFNNDMHDKWIELWAKHPNPSKGIPVKTWYQNVNTIYEEWMLQQIRKASNEGIPPPPLHSVGYTQAAAWANEIKASSLEPLRTGAVDEESRNINDQMSTYINSTDGAQNIEQFTSSRIGSAIDSSTLKVKITVQSANSIVFKSPTTQVVREELQSKTTKSNKKRKKEPPPVPPELLKRQAAAKERLTELKLGPAQKNGTTRRCNVCLQPWSMTLNDIKHVQLQQAKKGETIQTFCPFADDPMIYEAHEKDKKMKMSEKNKLKHIKRKQKKAQNSSNDTN